MLRRIGNNCVEILYKTKVPISIILAGNKQMNNKNLYFMEWKLIYGLFIIWNKYRIQEYVWASFIWRGENSCSFIEQLKRLDTNHNSVKTYSWLGGLSIWEQFWFQFPVITSNEWNSNFLNFRKRGHLERYTEILGNFLPGISVPFAFLPSKRSLEQRLVIDLTKTGKVSQ